MQLLVALTVTAATLLGAMADDYYTPSYQAPSYGGYGGPVGGPAPTDAVQKATAEFNRLYNEAAARAAAAPDDNQVYSHQQYHHGGPGPHYSAPRTYYGPSKRPVGGPAPADAVQKATAEFNRLYKAAAARAAAAPDDYQTYSTPKYHHGASGSYYGPSKRPVGGPAPTDAVRKATAEFNRLYKKAAARAAAAPDDYQVYSPQPHKPVYGGYDDDSYHYDY